MNKSEVEELRLLLKTSQTNLEDFFFVVAAILTFAMQAGFSLVEAGIVRTKNVTHVLKETTLDSFIGAIVYWLFGYAFAYGEGNDFIGWTGFALIGVPQEKLSYWFFQLIFANTASTIVSGAIAERSTIPAFVITSILLTGVMYPIACRWVWYEDGWLRTIGFVDCGGSGVVHTLGGIGALVASLLVGPRKGRFSGPVGSGRSQNDMTPHSITVTGTGSFFLLLGFLGYNMSTQLMVANQGDGSAVVVSSINTLLAGSSGAVTAFMLSRFLPFDSCQWSYITMLNGSIAGMVSACAGSCAMQSWAAFVVGIIGSLTFYALKIFLRNSKVDDVLDAFPVHFGGGFVGLMVVPTLMDNSPYAKGDPHSAVLFVHQLVGTVVLVLWGLAFTSCLFVLLKVFKVLPLPEELELEELTVECCGPTTYPAESCSKDRYLQQRYNDLLNLLRNAVPTGDNGCKTEHKLLELLQVLAENQSRKYRQNTTLYF